MVTMKDLLETIAGEFPEEFERQEEPAVQENADESLTVDGSFEYVDLAPQLNLPPIPIWQTAGIHGEYTRQGSRPSRDANPRVPSRPSHDRATCHAKRHRRRRESRRSVLKAFDLERMEEGRLKS